MSKYPYLYKFSAEYKDARTKENEIFAVEKKAWKNSGSNAIPVQTLYHWAMKATESWSIGHFRVAFCLCFKTSPGAQPLSWKLALPARLLSCKPNWFPYEKLCTTGLVFRGNKGKRQLENGLLRVLLSQVDIIIAKDACGYGGVIASLTFKPENKHFLNQLLYSLHGLMDYWRLFFNRLSRCSYTLYGQETFVICHQCIIDILRYIM